MGPPHGVRTPGFGAFGGATQYPVRPGIHHTTGYHHTIWWWIASSPTRCCDDEMHHPMHHTICRCSGTPPVAPLPQGSHYHVVQVLAPAPQGRLYQRVLGTQPSSQRGLRTQTGEPPVVVSMLLVVDHTVGVSPHRGGSPYHGMVDHLMAHLLTELCMPATSVVSCSAYSVSPPWRVVCRVARYPTGCSAWR